jgi:hypothetical protein
MKSIHKKLFVMNTLIFTMLSLSMIGQIVQPSTAQAAETNTGEIQYTLLEPLPCIPGDGVTCNEGEMQTSVNFETYVQYIFNLIIAFAAVAAVLMIVWGGFKYVTSDSFLGKNEGKKVIMQALQGLLLVLCSYLILRTIDPRLVAIPSTIVTPLEIKCASDTNILVSDPKCASVTTQMFTDISEAERKQIKISNQETLQQVNNLDNQITDIKKRISDYEMYSGEGLDKSTDVNWIAMNQELNKKVGERLSIFAIQKIKNSFLASDPYHQTLNEMSVILKDIQSTQSEYVSQLKKIGQSDKISEVQSQTTVIIAKLAMQAQLAVINRGKEYGTISGSLRDAFYYSRYGIIENLSSESAKSAALDNIIKITKNAQSKVSSKELNSEIGKY